MDVKAVLQSKVQSYDKSIEGNERDDILGYLGCNPKKDGGLEGNI